MKGVDVKLEFMEMPEDLQDQGDDTEDLQNPDDL